MNKRKYFYGYKICLAIVCCLTLMSFRPDDNPNFKAAKNLQIFNALFKELQIFYVDTLNTEKVVEAGINGMLSQTDPYTVFFPESEMDDLKLLLTGKYAGIGAVIRFYEPQQRVVVFEPMEGMPAQMAGVKAGDVILSVGGKEMVRGKQTPQNFTETVSNALKGEPGTSFVLKVKRATPKDSVVIDFKLTRKNIRQNPVWYAGLLKQNIGYINFNGFPENSAQDFRNAFFALKEKGATSFIIDLRGNGGGSLPEAIDIVNLFVPKGKEIVNLRGKLKQTQSSYKTAKDPVDVNIPLAVLVDGGTASAAEIVSGSLQDLDRAVVVGQRTFGKGLVQTTRTLPYNTQLKVTTSKYYIPSGRCIQAIDYSKKNPDGTVARIPDSLTSVFHTANGREVRDGGGIRPDVEVKEERVPNIVFYLENGDFFFDYANRYVIRHPELRSVDDFKLTDDDYAEFKKMVEDRHFTYDPQSEKLLKTLKEMATFEGYLESAKTEFEALEKKLNHNVARDLDYFSKPIKAALSQEIVSRYFYNRGTVMEKLKDDATVEAAIGVLTDASRYRKILSPSESPK